MAKISAEGLSRLPSTMRVVDPITTNEKIAVKRLCVMIATGRNVLPGKSDPTAVNDLGHLLAVPMSMIVAPGLHLLVGGIMKRGNLQGTMITGREAMMMTAESLIIIMTAAGMMSTPGDVTTVEAGAMKETIGTTIGQ
jgi:hypothetical protein